MEFNMYQPVWFNKELWIYLGINEDCEVVLFRPQAHSSFGTIEFESVVMIDPEYDEFMKENGEPFNDYCKRKGIEIPKIK